VVADLVDEGDPDLFVEGVVGVEGLWVVGGSELGVLVVFLDGAFGEGDDAASEESDVFGDGVWRFDGAFGEHDAGVEAREFFGEFASPLGGGRFAPLFSERVGEWTVGLIVDDDGYFFEE